MHCWAADGAPEMRSGRRMGDPWSAASAGRGTRTQHNMASRNEVTGQLLPRQSHPSTWVLREQLLVLGDTGCQSPQTTGAAEPAGGCPAVATQAKGNLDTRVSAELLDLHARTQANTYHPEETDERENRSGQIVDEAFFLRIIDERSFAKRTFAVHMAMDLIVSRLAALHARIAG